MIGGGCCVKLFFLLTARVCINIIAFIKNYILILILVSFLAIVCVFVIIISFFKLLFGFISIQLDFLFISNQQF